MEAKPRDHRTALVVTALSGLVLFGIGHLYVGRISRGIILIVTSVVLYLSIFSLPVGRAYDSVLVVLIVIDVGVYFFQLYDIWNITKEPRSGSSHG